MKPLRVVHETDPKQVILDDLGGDEKLIRVLGADVLVCVYERPHKTKSGLILTDKVRQEDRYQGKVGLVLSLGPLAFVDDDKHQFGDGKPKAGDWVMFRVGDTFGFEIGNTNYGETGNSRLCRLVEDVKIEAILDQPDIVF